ncbi:hypothetical protein JHK84_044040 [Glycine max]|nr:hypothetical protein JHK84_044040 [Glycine max]
MGDRAEAVISSTMDSHWIVSADSWSRWIIALSFGSVVRRGSSINNARSLSIVTDDDVLLDVVAIMLAPDAKQVLKRKQSQHKELLSILRSRLSSHRMSECLT